MTWRFRWPWRRARRGGTPPEAVTPAQQAQLERARRLAAARERALDERVAEINRVAAALDQAREINHLAERFRAAFGGPPPRRR